MSFALTYREILRACLERGAVETNHRTGATIKALTSGASFTVPLFAGILPTCGVRKTKPHIAAAENAWCILGHDHVDWLRRHTRVWDAFATIKDCVPCDGEGSVLHNGVRVSTEKCDHCDGTGKTFELPQAYGHRWRHAFGLDQLATGIERLRIDPSDRRVWISSWHPGDDILNMGQKTVPCPVGFSLSILEGRLCSSLMIRSSDLFMGLPYDTMRHAFLMAAVAASLSVNLGVMRVTLAHPHLYEAHWDHAHHATTVEPVVPKMLLFSYPISRIEENPDGYVEDVKDVASECEWPAFEPKLEVVR